MSTLIATFDNRQPARMLKSRFEKAGIQAKVHDDTLLQRLVFWTRPFASQKVYVENAQFEHARNLLEKWESTEHVLEDAIRCPECGSARVDYPHYTRKFITTLIFELLISLGHWERDCYCDDCHYTWPRAAKVRPNLDILGFPRHKESHRH